MLLHLFRASVILCALAGLAHLVIGLVSFEPLSPNLAWYLLAGMAMLLLALANWAVWHPVRHPERAVRLVMHVANFLMSLFGIVAAAATGEMRSQVALLGMLGLFLTGIALDRVVGARDEAAPTTHSS